jgi:hypothetical protein
MMVAALIVYGSAKFF